MHQPKLVAVDNNSIVGNNNNSNHKHQEQSLNITPLHTDTRWPAYQGQSAQNTEANRKTPSTNAAHPDAEYRSDQLHYGHRSSGQQTHRHSYASQLAGGASSIGSTPTHSEIDKGHSNPRKGTVQYTEHPHIPQFRTSTIMVLSGL